jgi:hypothetical protein
MRFAEIREHWAENIFSFFLNCKGLVCITR